MTQIRLNSISGKKTPTRKHSSRMRTDHDVTRPSSEPVSMRPIVDRQTPLKTLPSLAVGNYKKHLRFTQHISHIKSYETF